MPAYSMINGELMGVMSYISTSSVTATVRRNSRCRHKLGVKQSFQWTDQIDVKLLWYLHESDCSAISASHILKEI